MVLWCSFLLPSADIDCGFSLLIPDFQPETPPRTAVAKGCCPALPECWGNSFFGICCRGGFWAMLKPLFPIALVFKGLRRTSIPRATALLMWLHHKPLLLALGNKEIVAGSCLL